MSAVATATRRLRRRRLSRGRPRLRLSRQRRRLAVAIAALLIVVLGGGWLLLRDSSVVAIDHVTVTGVTGADAGAIEASLDSAARRMTTLDVSTAGLRAAVSGFPEINGLTVSTHFPHGIVIHVIEELPVAAVKLGGREIAVTGHGVLLPKVAVTGSLPVIALDQPPIGGRLPQSSALSAARLLSAAPRRLLPRLAEVTTVAGHGLVAQVRSGPSIYFGDASRSQAKWIAALAVLADPNSAGALYIDVTDPARPAAGAGEGAAQAAGATVSATTAATAGTTAATAGTTAATGATSSSSGASSQSAPATGGTSSSSTTTGG